MKVDRDDQQMGESNIIHYIGGNKYKMFLEADTNDWLENKIKILLLIDSGTRHSIINFEVVKQLGLTKSIEPTGPKLKGATSHPLPVK